MLLCGTSNISSKRSTRCAKLCGLHHVVLYSHSWGGWLAQEYLARCGGATHLDALILASTSACIFNRFLSPEKFLRNRDRQAYCIAGNRPPRAVLRSDS